MNLINIILEQCSQPVRNLVGNFLKELRAASLKSKKDWDNVLVHAVFLIFGIPYKSK